MPRSRFEKQLRNRGVFDPVRIKRLERMRAKLQGLGLTAAEFNTQLLNAKSQAERDALEARIS